MNWSKTILIALALGLITNGLILISAKADTVTSASTTTSATVSAQTGTLRIVGYASPQAIVYFQETGSIIGTQAANSSSYFDKTFTGVSPGIHLISLYATAGSSHTTLTITFSVNVTTGSTTIVSGVLLPSTLVLGENEVKRPFTLTATGRARSDSSVRVFISGSGDSNSNNINTNSNGEWSININPKLHLGNKTTYAMVLDNSGGQSEFSHSKNYEVKLSADLNADRIIDLTDFSIMMYDYGVGNPSNVLADVNDDGVVNLTDFSIMMYHWSGE